MPPIIKGLASVYSGPRRTFTPGVGWTSFDRYQFTDSASANAFAASQAALGYNITVEDRAPDYQVEVSVPDSGSGTPEEDVVDIYELPPLDTEKDITESPLFQALDSTDQTVIKAYRADPTDANYAAAVDFPVTAAGLIVLDLIRKGTTGYLDPSVEFRWTRIVGDTGLPAAAAGAYDSVAEIYTTAQLTGSIGGLPGVWATAISAAASAYPNPSNQINQPQYTKGWLKQQSNIVRRGVNRNEITLRWILGNWSSDLYA